MKKNKKSGFVISAELVLISTIMVLGLLVGMVAVRDAMIGELHDMAEAFGSLNQTYSYDGTLDASLPTFTQGSTFQDGLDAGDDTGYTTSIFPAPEGGQ